MHINDLIKFVQIDHHIYHWTAKIKAHIFDAVILKTPIQWINYRTAPSSAGIFAAFAMAAAARVKSTNVITNCAIIINKCNEKNNTNQLS